MFYLLIHGDFPDARYPRLRKVSLTHRSMVGCAEPVEFKDCCAIAIDIAKNGGTRIFGDLQKLERVIFYSSASKPYEVDGKTFMWLAGMRPNPADPSYMGFGEQK